MRFALKVTTRMESPELAIGSEDAVEEMEGCTRVMEDETRRNFLLRIHFIVSVQ